MKPLRPNAALLALSSALWILSGCQHKQPVPIVPHQPPPTAAPSPSPTPEGTAAQQAEQQQDQPNQAQSPSPEQQKPEPEQKEKAKQAKKSPRHKPAQPATNAEKPGTDVARNTPPKKIIPAEKAEPTPPPGQISPGPTPAAGPQDRAATEQLLQLAEANLNGIKRQLTRDEEVKRTQVKEFISQSRKAVTENDPDRAHRLAVKAQVLSDELVKQR